MILKSVLTDPYFNLLLMGTCFRETKQHQPPICMLYHSQLIIGRGQLCWLNVFMPSRGNYFCFSLLSQPVNQPALTRTVLLVITGYEDERVTIKIVQIYLLFPKIMLWTSTRYYDNFSLLPKSAIDFKSTVSGFNECYVCLFWCLWHDFQFVVHLVLKLPVRKASLCIHAASCLSCCIRFQPVLNFCKTAINWQQTLQRNFKNLWVALVKRRTQTHL